MFCKIERANEGSYHLKGISLEKFEAEILARPAWNRMPYHFGARLWIEDHLVASKRAPPAGEVMAVHVEPAHGVRSEVVLSDSNAVYASVAERTRRTALLIALAAVAAAVGWFAAWRAFVRQRQLVAMKDDFVSAVSHELKAPIAAIGLMAEEIENGVHGAENSRQYAQLIAGECTRLGSLVQNVLDYARIEAGREAFEFEEADLGELSRAVGDLMRPTASERDMDIEVDAPDPGELCADVDAHALGRVLVNLLDNAIKYAPAGTEIKLTAERHGKGGFRLIVADSGKPISPAEQERIFERFVRSGRELTRETVGVGIGLSLVRHVAHAHGGRTRVQVDETGNRFLFEVDGNRTP
jgi:two-component system phosphate regulon sensor histidine kinase PhoR